MNLLLELITQYGLLFVFVAVLVEQAGVPVPAYPVLLLAGARATEGGLALAAALGVAVLACLLADGLWYLAGRRHGRRVLRLMCKLSLSPDGCVRQTESIFTRWGAPSLVVAKFVPGFASVATSMAGSMGIRRGAFLFYDAVGSTLWAGLGLLLGALFASAIDDIITTLEQMGRWGLLLIGGLLLLFLAGRALRRMRFQRQLRMDRISVADLADLFDRGEAPLVVDVRQVLSLDDARIPGALVLSGDEWPDELRAADGEQALVVVYCACPNEASAVRVAQRLMQRGFKRVRPLTGGIDAWRDAGRAVVVAAVLPAPVPAAADAPNTQNGPSAAGAAAAAGAAGAPGVSAHGV